MGRTGLYNLQGSVAKENAETCSKMIVHFKGAEAEH